MPEEQRGMGVSQRPHPKAPRKAGPGGEGWVMAQARGEGCSPGIRTPVCCTQQSPAGMCDSAAIPTGLGPWGAAQGHCGPRAPG